MSVIIRLQNLPWSANALDIRNFFRGLSIPEGGVHIVGGELGDAFIAFSTDEDARQAMMLGGGKIKEIQVKLHLSSRSEMHKVIETARQTVPILTLTAPAPAPAPAPPPAPSPAPIINPFAAALAASNPLASLGIPGLGNPLEIPQPAVIEPPAPLSISPPIITTPVEKDDDDRVGPDPYKRKEKDRRRSRSRSRSRDKKDRKRDRRDRSRSRESRRRRDRSRSRDRRDRKRDRKDRSRSRDRSPSRQSRDRRDERRSPNSQPDNRATRNASVEQPPAPAPPPPPVFNSTPMLRPNFPAMQVRPQLGNGQNNVPEPVMDDPIMLDTYNRLQELGKKRNPNAFQGEQNGGPSRFHNGGVGLGNRGGRRDHGRGSRFEPEHDSCVAIRNAPNHTSYGDVRRFFPFMIDKHGIKMINDNMGRRTGNIFVRFCEPRSKNLALQRRNNELKGQEVTVEHLDDADYESAIDSFLPFREEREEPPAPPPEPEPEPEPFTVVRLSDLPNHVKEHDIIKIFSDYSLLSIMLTDCRKTRTRTAYVQFVKAEDAKQAFERREQYVFGRRQATVEPLSNEEYDREKTMQAQAPPALPVEASPSPEPVVPRDPRQRREPPAQPNYFAPGFVQSQPAFPPAFANQFNPGFIPPVDPRANVDPRGPPAWGVRAGFPQPKHNEPPERQPMEDEPLDCVLIKGLPREATDRTIVQFLSDTGAVPTRIHLMLDPSGMPSGDCFCEFRSVSDARCALSKHGESLDGCRVSVDLVGRGVVEDALDGPKMLENRGLLGEAPMVQQPFFENPRGGFGGRGGFRGRGIFERGGFDRGFDRGRGGMRGRGGFDRGRGGFEGRGRGFDRGLHRGGFGGRPHRELEREMGREEGDPALQDFGAPGCVVSMENVPFRATVDDILRFFGDFELTQDDVIRRFNEKGQPTGDARVAFQTPFMAQKAAKNHNFDLILDRRISLSIL